MNEDIVKITAAAYKVLDTLPDGDPLKNQAKEKALEILDMAAAQNVDAEKLAAGIAALENYLQIAKSQGWLNDMNVLILAKEYRQLASLRAGARGQGLGFREKEKPVKILPKTNLAADFNLSGRQQEIIKILQENQKAQVADLIKKLPSITKRTIRRDLDDLLKRGKIVRAGEFNQIFYQIS